MATVLAGLNLLQVYLGPEGWLPPVADKFMLAVGRRTPFSSAHSSPRDCVRVLPTWQPVFPAVTDPRERKRKQGGSDDVFYDLTMDVTLPHFCRVLLVTQISPIPCGKGLYRSVTARRQNLLWASWSLAATLSHRISEDEIN